MRHSVEIPTGAIRGTRAIARALGKSHATVARWCADGLLPAVRLNGAWHVLPAAIPAYWLALGAAARARGVDTPGGSGVVMGARPPAATPSPDKKTEGKDLNGNE